MRTLGKVFDGSTSLFDTPTRLMQLYRTCYLADPVHTGSSRSSTFYLGTTFCSLDIYCSYIAGVLDKYYLEDDSCICHLYIAHPQT